MAQHLINAGYTTIASLKGQNPEEVYFKDCIKLYNKKLFHAVVRPCTTAICHG
jgi:hypothetical protein